ncbi:MAG: GxGYxYP family putative glycoside hydrolase [Planctomycetota bacterium]|nr:GxGYxYP family putative glycoside hydrolase [Planctomycetota bacterium]
MWPTLVVVAAQLAQSSPASPKDETIYLNRVFNHDGFEAGGAGKAHNLGGTGKAYRSEEMPKERRIRVDSARYGKVSFLAPDPESDSNMVACEGQTIRVRTTRVFNSLFVLGMAHHGSHPAWIEFRFQDGSRGRGPFGLSDWFGQPVFGEEVAFRFTPPPRTSTRHGFVSIWMQRTSIPGSGKLRSITLPNQPRMKILALTLGQRDGARIFDSKSAGRVAPAPVAIFSERGFPSAPVGSAPSATELRKALEEVGIRAALLGLEQLRAPGVLDPKDFPLLVHLHGGSFPVEAADDIRQYRQRGGSLLFLGPPYRRAVLRSPYHGWTYPRTGVQGQGWVTTYTDRSRPEFLGAGRHKGAAAAPLAPTKLLESWGLGGLPWKDLEPRAGWAGSPASYALDVASLPDGVEVRPLVRFGATGDSFAAIVRHQAEDDPFRGSYEVWIGGRSLWSGSRPVSTAVATDFLVRSAGWLLWRKSRIDEKLWAKIRAAPPPAMDDKAPTPLLSGDDPASLFPRSRAPTEILVVDVSDRSAGDRLVLASAQGLLSRAGTAVFLADGSAAAAGQLERLKALEGIRLRQGVALDELFQRLEHRRAVVADPSVYGSLNVATMVASLEGLLIAYPGTARKFRLEVSVDLRGLFDDAGEMARWTYENLWPRCRKDLLCVYPPADDAYQLRDYLVAHRIFTFWLPSECDLSSPGSSPEEEYRVVERILEEAPAVCPVLGSLGDGTSRGLGRDEGVAYLSRFGKYFVPLDVTGTSLMTNTLPNLSLLSSLPSRPRSPAGATKRPRTLASDKIYLAVLEPPSDAAALSGADAGESSGDRAANVEAGAVLDLLPGSKAPAGVAGLGLVDLAGFGAAFGPARKSVVEAYFSTLGRFVSTHGIRFLTAPPDPRFRERIREGGIEELLPETAIFVPYDPGSSRNALTASYRLGKAAVFHDAGAAALGRLFSGEDAAFRSLLPLFLVTQTSTLQAVQSAGTLPDDVVQVTPEELHDLYRQWSRSRRLVGVEVVAPGSRWKYHDKGEDLGVEWREADYNDRRWKEGAAELGYGDANSGKPEATVISFGENAQQKHSCYYFRRTFRVAESRPLRLLLLEVIVDDGCVVYLNGKEVQRHNMPDGEPSYSTWAPRASGPTVAAEHTWQQTAIETSRLERGENTLAVEVHQSSGSSSDVSFDLKLSGYRVDVVK